LTEKSKNIDKKDALQIAIKEVSKSLQPDPSGFKVYSKKPERLQLYNVTSEPCWFVYAPRNDGHNGIMLRSSRVILISKKTGRVLYDGSANDEG